MTRKLARGAVAVVVIVAIILFGGVAGCSRDSAADAVLPESALPFNEQDAPEATPTPTPPFTSEADAEDMMLEEAEALLGPIAISVDVGASPEQALRELVELSCAQRLTNPMYWDYADRLYRDLLDRGTKQELLVSDWPPSLAGAMMTCFE